jgi:hypothetical protein
METRNIAMPMSYRRSMLAIGAAVIILPVSPLVVALVALWWWLH